MKIVVNMRDLRLRASSRHGGQVSFFEWDFCYMLNINLNAHGGFTPAAVAPPKRDNPEQVIRHLAQRSALWGTGTASHSLYQNFVFHIIAKYEKVYRANF